MLVRSNCVYTVGSIYPFLSCRHPETSSRPTFVDLVSDFSEPDVELLHTETDTCLGAHLETAYNLYPELQRKYIY